MTGGFETKWLFMPLHLINGDWYAGGLKLNAGQCSARKYKEDFRRFIEPVYKTHIRVKAKSE